MRIDLGSHALHVIDQGPRDGPAVVLLHEFGTSSALWAEVIAHLPEGLRILVPDLPGHGASGMPETGFKMGTLIGNIEKVLEHLGLSDTVLVGLGIGGMIAQGLAIKRLDLVRGLCLVNSAARLGIAAHWERLAQEIDARGSDVWAERAAAQWFTKTWIQAGASKPYVDGIKAMHPTVLSSYINALKGSDFYTPTSGLRLPTLGIAGADDRFVPPDMARETTDLVPGSSFELIRRSAHLTPIDQPELLSTHLNGFLRRIAHC